MLFRSEPGDVVVEAITENEGLKTQAYRELSGIVREDAILATNTSTISITRMAQSVKHPERFVTAAFGGAGVQETDPALREKAIALDKPMPTPQGAEAAAFNRLRELAAARAKQAGPSAPAPAPLQIERASCRERVSVVV